MKSSIEKKKLVAIINPAEASALNFSYENDISLGKLIISKLYTSHFFSSETIKVLGKVQFLKSQFSCCMS